MTRSPAPVVAFLAATVRTGLPALTDRLIVLIKALEPMYDELGVVPDDDLWRSCHDNLARIVQALTLVGELPPDLLDAPTATGRRRAEQGLPLESLLHSYRLGGRVVWEAIAEQARDGSPDAQIRLLEEATHVWEVIDTFSAAVAASYRQTEGAAARRHEQRAHALVEALVSGRGSERGIAQAAAAVLDLPEQAAYAVVVAETSTVPGGGLSRLAGLLGTHARVASGMRPGREIALVALDMLGATDLVRAVDRCASARAGVGSVVSALADVGRSYRFAELALRTLEPGTRATADVHERLPTALLMGDPDLTDLLVRRIGGRLLELEPEDRALLLETMQVWIECKGSAVEAATRLYCHRNTVLNRLRRLELLTGRLLSSPADLVEIVLMAGAMRLSRADLPVVRVVATQPTSATAPDANRVAVAVK